MASYRKLLCALFSGIFLAITNNANAFPCGKFDFADQHKLVDRMSRSTGKIYKDKTGKNYSGVATVIDSVRGLLITADHVVKGKKITFHSQCSGTIVCTKLQK